MSVILDQKEQELFSILRSMGRVLVAYSGGTDSAYLAWAAGKVLADGALAVTADSASIPASHKKDAEDFISCFGLNHQYVETHEFENPNYSRNDATRCFHCKDELFERLKEIGSRLGFENIVYGVNADDTSDFRPGHQAAHKHGVRAPLLEVNLKKSEIRELSLRHGLPTWNRPAAACLSSRIPYGTEVTRENVKLVEAGEEALRNLGFRIYRVRYHKELARLELGPDDLPRALSLEMTQKLTQIFKGLGFKYVTLDLEGYRQGSLNEVLPNTTKNQLLPILS